MDESDSSSDLEEVHQELLEKVCSISKRTREKQRTEGAVVASDYHLPPTRQDGKVAMSSLLRGLGSTRDKVLVNLGKKLGSMEEKHKPMDTPLNKIQADRVNREAANELTCKEVGKWDPIVKKNREAEHLSFPLQPDELLPPSLSSRLETFQPSTELEKEVAAILSRSENVEGKGQELTESEKKSLFQMSIEEAMERKKELQKHRALMFAYEQKCKRIRRIKSKKFHKVRRKHLEKKSGKPANTDEELTKLRAKERMTLKHGNKAKWARKQHSREHRDPATQLALTEHHQRKIQLKEKLPSVPEDDEEDESVELESGAESDDDVTESQAAVVDSKNPWLSSLTRTKGQPRSEEPWPNVAPKTIVTSSFMRTDNVSSTDKTRVSKGKNARKNEGVGDLGRASKQLLSIREAFAGDDVVEEFQREKEELERQDDVSDIPAALPGWGSWGGMGVKAKKKRKEADMAPPTVRTKKPRRDAGMKHVIIAENQISKKLERHLVQSVPFPYTSKEQFEKTHCMPIGRHWNTEAIYQQMIQPKITTKAGEVIKPLVLTEEVQNFMERESTKKKMKEKKLTKK